MVGQLGKLIVQLAGVVVLSRLLTPEDFGLIAMVAVFVGLGELLRDFGMPTAALQAKELSQAQASNFFWANTLLGALASALLIASTPLIVLLYGQAELAAVVPVLAIAPLLNGVQAQLQVRLARHLRFGAIALTDVLASVAGLLAACAVALAGFGYWALVAQSLTIAVVLLASRWVLTGWAPGRPSRGAGSRRQLTAGGHFGLAQALTYAASNVDTLVIGSRFGPEWAGYYNRAFQVLTVPVSALLGPLTQVVVPTVNHAVKAGRNETDVLLRIQFALGFVVVGVFLAAAVTAPSLIPLALGPNWTESVALFQILAIGGCVQVLSYVSYWAFIVGDHGKQLLYYNLVTKPLAVCFILIGSVFGPLGVAAGYSLGLVVSWPINLLWLARLSPRGSRAFFVSGLRVLISAGIAYVVGSFGLMALPDLGLVGDVAVGTCVSLIAFVLVLLVAQGSRNELMFTVRAGRAILRRGAIDDGE